METFKITLLIVITFNLMWMTKYDAFIDYISIYNPRESGWLAPVFWAFTVGLPLTAFFLA